MWAGHSGLWAVSCCPHGAALAPCRLQQCRCPTVSVASGRRPGRPKKDQTDEEIAARAAAGRRKASSAPKKRGPKPTTSGDTLQLLDPDVLEELKATAAAEEAVRLAQPAEPEADPARFNFHRILMNAASRGLPEEAEKVVSQMQGAGLPPGPRAYHALAFAYVRAKQAYEALDVARRAAELDLQLLPETFVVLIFSLLNHPDNPDVTSAQQVLESMEAQGEYMGADASGVPVAQAGWLMLCKELFRKGLIAEAMTSVKRGYDAKGYVSDPELAAFVIVQLAKAGLKDRAYQEVLALEALGYRPGPEHYNPLIKAEAALGAWRRARYLMLDAFQKPNWMPPNADSFTALLEGMVLSVDPVSGMPTGPGVESDASGRLKDVERPSAVDDMDEQDMQAATSGTQALGEQFKRLREEMLRFGLRPNAAAYAAMCSGYIKMRATDEALGSFQAMCDAGVAGGTTRLLPKKRLTALLVMLTEDDRPADMLNILKALVSFNQPLPKSAMAPLDHVTPGATLTAAWLPAHFEYMRGHPDDGTGREVGGTAMASMRNMLTEAAEAEDFDGVLISKLGGGVVADDGSGVWLKPSKMTLDELRAELEHAGIEYPEGAKKKILSALVKARRESLPRSVTEIQSHLEASRKAEAEALERKTGIKIDDGSKSSKKGKTEIKEFKVFQMEDGKLSKIQNIVQEVAKKKVGFTVERGGKDPYGADDALSSEGAGEVEDDDELADILKEGVDEGIADIVRDPDSVFGDASEGMPGADGVLMDDGTGLEITIDHIEARVLNRTAGMRVALEVLRCVEMLGGSPSGPDYEALVAGVLAEGNAVAALELSERLPRLLSLGYSRESVLSLFEQLARVCLNALKGGSADLVLERAEDLGLEPDAGLYAMLSKALGDRPRHRQLAAAEMQDLVEDSVNPDLLIQDDEVTEAEGTTRMPLVADDDIDEEDEEEAGVYGRIPTAQPVGGEEAEAGPAALTGDPSWKAKGQAGVLEAPPVPIAIQLLSRLSDDVMPEGLLDELQYISQAGMSPTPTLLPDGIALEGEVEQAGVELEDGSVDLGDGHVVTRAQLDLIDAEVARGAREWEALAAAGLITAEEAEQMKELMGQGEADAEEGEQPESDDEDYQEAERDFKELLGGAMFELVAAAQQRVAELDEQAEEAREQGDEEGASELLEQSLALQAELQAELQPRMAEFLQRGMSEERIAKWDAAVDRQLADDESYRLAAREIFTEQLEAAGYTVTQQVLDQWDASPTLLQISNDPEQPLAQFYEQLSQMEDGQAMIEALGELEARAASSMALSGPREPRLLTAPSSDKP